ncbi:MAG: hypothetical protein RLZZ15_3921, partial [Verrucomicrobiota bacterium]
QGGGGGGRAAAAVAAVVGAVVGLAGATAVGLSRLASRPLGGGAGVRLAGDGKNPVELPAILGRAWVGLPAAVTAVERQVLPADTGYSRMNYVASSDRRQVFLSIVLSGRDRTSIHRPELCLAGQGWTITGATRERFAFPGAVGAAFPATVLRVRRDVAAGARGAAPQLVAYWFVGADVVVASHGERLARDAWNRLAHGRADRWAYVLAQTDAADGEAAALDRMRAVLHETLPAFQLPPPAP